MRHGNKVNSLGRKVAHRKSMLANMASSLIMHKRINTTVAKAKALRTYIEPLITKSKEDSTHTRRIVFSYLQNKDAVSTLFREVSPKVADRPGGYTRILKTGNRLGDNADMCFIELVDFNENMLKAASDKKSKTTRRGRSKKKKTDEKVVAASDSEKAETSAPEAAVEAAPEAKAEAPKKEEAPGSDEKDETKDTKDPKSE